MLCFRQPQIQLSEHLRATRKAQDKKHVCNEFILKASCLRLDPHRLVLQRAFKNTYELMIALNSEYGAASGKPIINVFTEKAIDVGQLGNDEHMNEELTSILDKISKLGNSIAQMTKDKGAAAANENFQEAMRLKAEIERAEEQKASHTNKAESLRRQMKMMVEAREKGKALGATSTSVHVGEPSSELSSRVEEAVNNGFAELSQGLDAFFSQMISLGSEQRDLLRKMTEMCEHVVGAMVPPTVVTSTGQMVPAMSSERSHGVPQGQVSVSGEKKENLNAEPPTDGSGGVTGEDATAIVAPSPANSESEQEDEQQGKEGSEKSGHGSTPEPQKEE